MTKCWFLALALATGCAGSLAKPKAPEVVHVEQQLDRAAVKAKLAARRAVVIDRFLAYRDGRVYPVNNLPGGGFRHVWIDEFGNLCAAATLISHDLGREAAIELAKDNLELKLADVATGKAGAWMLTSGLTHHELVAIQVPGWQGMRQPIAPEPMPAPDPRIAEVERLFQIYIDVERQLRDLADESLELATDALMKQPALARRFVAQK